MVPLRTARRVLIAWSIEPTRGRVHENLFVFLVFVCVCRSFGVDISLVVLFLVLEVLQAQVHLLVVELILFHLFSPHGAFFHLLGVTKSSFPSRFGVHRRWLCAGSWFYCGSIRSGGLVLRIGIYMRLLLLLLLLLSLSLLKYFGIGILEL